MSGERLTRAELTDAGLTGDRVVQVYDRQGRIVTSRTRPRLLRLRTTLGPDAEPLVEGLPWTSPEVSSLVEEAAGPGARLQHHDGLERFDILPLLVCTDGAISAFGRDGRRLRPNLIIAGVPGLAERAWPGQTLAIGDALVGLNDLRGRCVMTTYDPETGTQNPDVLRDIVRRFEGKLCLNARVLRGGVLTEGHVVHLRGQP
jgi:uncharacterized protein YcbX